MSVHQLDTAEGTAPDPADRPVVGGGKLVLGSLTDSRGVTYMEFKKRLRPRYARVWRDILLGHAALAGILAGVGFAAAAVGGLWAAPVAVAGAVAVGYFLAYLALFIHEAAHYHLARSRAANDRLANLAIGMIFGQDVRGYRPAHFDHHRRLGTTRDTENTYFQPLTFGFLVEGLTGLKLARYFLRKLTAPKPVGPTAPTAGAGPAPGKRAWLVAGLLLNCALVVGPAAAGLWAVSAAWVLGMAVFFPFFASLRQLLEHRRGDADPAVDYARVDQGAVTRIFGDGIVASTFGGAGFNRHLLHHLDPQVSYVHLPAVEAFLSDTALRPALDAHRTTYFRAFRALFGRTPSRAAQDPPPPRQAA